MESSYRKIYNADTTNAQASVNATAKTSKEHFETLKNSYEGKEDG